MKIKINLKDGSYLTTDVSSFNGNGNFFDLIQKGIEHDASVTLIDNDGNTLNKKWSDVMSIEIILI